MTQIKMLSLWQTWASLCVWTNPNDGSAEKQIETRHWKTDYRGLLAIHAAKRTPQEDELNFEIEEALFRAGFHSSIHGAKKLPFGAIVGVVELVDCIRFSAQTRSYFKDYPKREWSFGNFEVGRFGWILKNHCQFAEPIYCRGLQGLGKPQPEIQTRIFERIESSKI